MQAPSGHQVQSAAVKATSPGMFSGPSLAGRADDRASEPAKEEAPVEYLSALLGLLDMDAESFDPDLVMYVVKFISMVLASPEVRCRLDLLKANKDSHRLGSRAA